MKYPKLEKILTEAKSESKTATASPDQKKVASLSEHAVEAMHEIHQLLPKVCSPEEAKAKQELLEQAIETFLWAADWRQSTEH